jgi:hypothetical protein
LERHTLVIFTGDISQGEEVYAELESGFLADSHPLAYRAYFLFRDLMTSRPTIVIQRHKVRKKDRNTLSLT